MARNGCAPEQHAGKGDNAETQGASFATSFSTEDGELEAQEKLKGLWDGCHAQETQCATAGGEKKNQSVLGILEVSLMSTACMWAEV